MRKEQLTIPEPIHLAITERLFGLRTWLTDREEAAAVDRLLGQMNLHEYLDESKTTWRLTQLGKELHADVLAVFLGVMDPWDAVFILWRNGLISDIDEQIFEQGLAAAEDAEELLKATVQAAYLSYLGRQSSQAVN